MPAESPAATGDVQVTATDVPRADQGLKRHQRLVASSLFEEAFNQQDRLIGRLMVVWMRRGEGAALRLGVVTSRKVGPAVDRVRARRLLREVFRRHRSQLTGAVDLVVVGRRDLVRASWTALEREFIYLVRKAGLLKPAANG
jgi:ribonuclease P protein component